MSHSADRSTRATSRDRAAESARAARRPAPGGAHLGIRPGAAVAVTGLGVVTPAGADEHSFWAGLCSGLSAARRCEELVGLPVDFACPVDGVDLDAVIGGRSVWRMARFVKLALVAARQAVADAGHDPARWDGGRVGVVLGVGVGGVSVLVDNARRLSDDGPDAVSPLLVPMMIPNAAAGEVAIALRAHGPSLAPVTACASGATAISVARDLLDSGQCDIVVAGGAESVLTPLVVTAFARMGALSTRSDDPASASRPFAADRDGFVMGEGAAMLVMERADDVRARGGRTRALLAGAGSSTDAYHPTAPEPDGRGAQRAVEEALRQAGWAPGEVDHVNAHGTSTLLNDAMETALIGRLFPHAPTVTAPKGVVGHTLAAAGAIEAVATVLTLEHGLVPPIANLDSVTDAFALDCVVKEPRRQCAETAVSHSFGFGGHNVALAFRRA
ncbi:beta-ketoacyl-[acyl-carrier-protein] synthase family protein [Streptomyces sp. NBC_00102]|uniref:beta-ketoacyl-[acyl-carrier-protein] synthase family protein n=1 Tax=Streptomyces sp. NBC_00102 TaxID=2975652 RepID=UPI0022578A81|nr:beta-ketoacyl-[acyl-carrier-protein] synthase family protein [Streptomyces sp. NBC_00102]MCX5401460.1 beta-ketoacyl-[acyl-carrier-protein] synthase family protein [Streptomyces sp. NBC_00102]